MKKFIVILFILILPLISLDVYAQITSSRDNTKVKKSGDTMTGDLKGTNNASLIFNYIIAVTSFSSADLAEFLKEASFRDKIRIANFIEHDGDPNTFWVLSTDNQKFVAGGLSGLELSETGTDDIIYFADGQWTYLVIGDTSATTVLLSTYVVQAGDWTMPHNLEVAEQIKAEFLQILSSAGVAGVFTAPEMTVSSMVVADTNGIRISSQTLDAQPDLASSAVNYFQFILSSFPQLWIRSYSDSSNYRRHPFIYFESHSTARMFSTTNTDGTLDNLRINADNVTFRNKDGSAIPLILAGNTITVGNTGTTFVNSSIVNLNRAGAYLTFTGAGSYLDMNGKDINNMGDAYLGGSSLISTNLLLKQGDSSTWHFKDSGDSNFVNAKLARLDTEYTVTTSSAEVYDVISTSKPVAYMSWYLNRSSETTINTAETYELLCGTATLESMSGHFKATVDANGNPNQVNYQGKQSRIMNAEFNGCLADSTASASTIRVKLYKNGVALPPTSSQYQPVQDKIETTYITYIFKMDKNDYVEVKVTTDDASNIKACEAHLKIIPVN